MKEYARILIEQQKSILDRETVILSTGMFDEYYDLVCLMIYDDGYVGICPFRYEHAFAFRSLVSKDFVDRIEAK